MKKVRSEASRVASLIKSNKAEFYIADVELENPNDDMILTVDSIVKILGKYKAVFMLIATDLNKLYISVYVPPELNHKIDGKVWLDNSIKNINSIEYKNETSVIITSEDSFKLKDIVRSSGFKYLSDNKCMEYESSEEFIGFDDI